MTNEDDSRPVPVPVRGALVSALAESLPMERHPVAVYLASLSAGSRRTMASALRDAAGLLSAGAADPESLDWGAVRYQHLAALRTLLADRGGKPATINRKLAAVRGVLREAWRLGLMTGEDFARVADVKGLRASVLPAGRALSGEEVQRMKSACNPGAVVGLRDRAALALMARGGLRRAELVGLDVEDFQDGPEAYVVVRGKGAKERLVPVTGGALEALRDWMEVRGDCPGAFLLPVRRGGTVRWDSRLTTSAIWKRLRGIAEAAGVGTVSPHDLRRTAATHLLDAGADVCVVAGLLGHASVETTRRYDRRGERAARDATRLVSF